MSDTRRCRTCARDLPLSSYSGNTARRCEDCKAYAAGRRTGRVESTCRRCNTRKHRSEFPPQMQICNACRSASHRTCTMCGESKPVPGGFYRSGKDRLGQPKYAARCKRCADALNAAYLAEAMKDPVKGTRLRAARAEACARWKEANPAKVRDLERAWRAELQADPDRHRRRKEDNRINYRLRREVETGIPVDQLRSLSNGISAPRSGDPYVPTAPLLELLDETAERDSGGEMEIILERIGMHARTIFRWRTGEQEMVHMTVADQVLTRLDKLWWEVFTPDTVSDPDALHQVQIAFEGEYAEMETAA